MEPMEKRIMFLEAAGRLSWKETRWMVSNLCRKGNTAVQPYPELWGGFDFDAAEGGFVR